MKELKYNLIHLLKRKGFYFAFITVMWIVLLHLLTIFFEGVDGCLYPEFMNRAEELFVVYNPGIILVLMYFIYPIVCSFVFRDVSWMDPYKNPNKIEYLYLDYKKNIVIQWFLTIIVSFLIIFTAFMFEYITLRYVFGSGFVYAGLQHLPFALPIKHDIFMLLVKDNMWLYAMYTSASVAMIFALLAAIAYSISLYVEKKRFIFIGIVVFMLLFDILFTSIGLDLSILNYLSQIYYVQIKEYLVLYVVLFSISFGMMIVKVFQVYRKGKIKYAQKT